MFNKYPKNWALLCSTVIFLLLTFCVPTFAMAPANPLPRDLSVGIARMLEQREFDQMSRTNQAWRAFALSAPGKELRASLFAPLTRLTLEGAHPRLAPKITALLEQISTQMPLYYALGGAAGDLYRISDPYGKVPPFIFSGVAELTNAHVMAVGKCPQGSQLPNSDQLRALLDVMSPHGVFNRAAIPHIEGRFLWSDVIPFGNKMGESLFLNARSGSLEFHDLYQEFGDNEDGVVCCVWKL